MKTTGYTLAAALLLCAALPRAQAGLFNQIPSCYTASHYTLRSSPPQRLLYVLIDQAAPLGPSLQKSVIENINHALGPGTEFVISEFSRATTHHYLRPLYTGIIESPLTARERDHVPMNSLSGFDRCMRDQAIYALRMADTTAQRAMGAAAGGAAQANDILFSLQEVAPAIADDPAAQKVLFLVTDGIEDSKLGNFSQGVADPGRMVQAVRKAGLMPNFGGARVFVLGAGVSP